MQQLQLHIQPLTMTHIGTQTAMSVASFSEARDAIRAFAEERQWSGYHTPRNLALMLVGELGELSECLQSRTHDECANKLQGFSEEERSALADEISDCVSYAVRLADQCWIDLPRAIRAKIELNGRKYPADLARNNAQKYVAYADVTKIDVKANQQQAVSARLASQDESWGSLQFAELAGIVQDFARAREWERFHTPRDITLALVGEVGELCELFQWKTEEGCAPGLPKWKDEAVALVAQELSDVCIYLVRLADICGIDLGSAFTSKMARNKAKYDPALVINGGRKAYEGLRNLHRAMRARSSSWEQLQDALSSVPGVAWTLGSMVAGGIVVLGVQKILYLKSSR